MIDGPVERGQVTRQVHPGDRRRVTLSLTSSGQAAMAAALQITRTRPAEHLAVLPDSQRLTTVRAMQTLRPVFATESPAAAQAAR